LDSPFDSATIFESQAPISRFDSDPFYDFNDFGRKEGARDVETWKSQSQLGHEFVTRHLDNINNLAPPPPPF
jgi:hypothetical protein